MTEEEIKKQVQAIEKECHVLAKEYEKLGTELAAKNEELAHWQAVMQSYRKRQEPPSLLLQAPATYKNLSHREIVHLIRDQNGGNIPMKQLIQVLRGKVVNPNHASGSAYTIVRRLEKQGKLTKVRPGLYRWIRGDKDGR